MGLPCLSCKEEVPPNEVKVFAEVFLCKRCHKIAKRLYERGEAELRMMLLVLKESIRLAALKGELNFSLQYLDDMKKEDLMSHLSKLADEARKKSVPVTENESWKREILEPTQSLETTSLPALPVGGKPNSH